MAAIAACQETDKAGIEQHPRIVAHPNFWDAGMGKGPTDADDCG